jgi:hypothetical protein
MKTFKWVVEFEVSETWVADGFVIDNFNAKEMLANALPYADGSEFKADVIQAPFEKEIRKVQGYKS